MIIRPFSSDVTDLIKQSGVALILKVIGAASTFVLSIVISRSLGAEGSGVFFLALAIITLLSTVGRLGLDNIVTRLVAEKRTQKNWSEINALYRNAFTATLLASCSLTIFVYVLAPELNTRFFQSATFTPTFRWMSLSLVGLAAIWLHSHFFQGMGQISRFQWCQNLGVTVVFLFLLGAAWLIFGPTLTIVAYAQAYVAAAWLSLMLAFFLWQFSNKWFDVRDGRILWRSIWEPAMPLLGIALMQQLMTWLPQIILGAACPIEQTGIFNAALRTANLTAMILMGVNAVVLPKFAAIHTSGNMHRLMKLSHTSTVLMLLTCIPFFLLLLVIPGTVLGMFGNEFRPAENVLRILAIGQLVNVATGSVGGLLKMTGNQAAELRCTLFAFAGLLVSQAVLVPTFGIYGSAISQLITMCLQMGLTTYVCIQRLGFAPMGGLRWWARVR